MFWRATADRQVNRRIGRSIFRACSLTCVRPTKSRALFPRSRATIRSCPRPNPSHSRTHRDTRTLTNTHTHTHTHTHSFNSTRSVPSAMSCFGFDMIYIYICACQEFRNVFVKNIGCVILHLSSHLYQIQHLRKILPFSSSHFLNMMIASSLAAERRCVGDGACNAGHAQDACRNSGNRESTWAHTVKGV